MRRRLGRYRLERRLAVGGMAEVYLATAEGLSGFEKRVVVKRLLPQHARSPELVAMFLDEARLCAALRHPHIAEVYDVGHDQDDYYFVMEHVPGRDLGELLGVLHGEPLPLPEAVAIGAAVAEGLHHAHGRRDGAGRLLEIVHRDVSPSNVLVGTGGEVKLIDFGVAKWAAQRTETRHGVLKGKCAYMSPEQCRAEPLDRRSDVFSLGVLLYEITTGRRPFEGANDFEVMTAVVRGEPPAPSRRREGYPAELEVLIVQALAARREDRPPTARALADGLGAFAARGGRGSSPAALAALVARLGGPAVERAVRAEVPTEPGHPPSAAAALARTATDHLAASALAAPEPPAAPARTRRWLASVAALAVIGAGVALAARARHAPPVAAPPARPAATVTANAGRPQPPPARSVPPLPPPATETVRRPSRPHKRPAPPPVAEQPAAPPPAPTVKVWDPDSPTPP